MFGCSISELQVGCWTRGRGGRIAPGDPAAVRVLRLRKRLTAAAMFSTWNLLLLSIAFFLFLSHNMQLFLKENVGSECNMHKRLTKAAH